MDLDLERFWKMVRPRRRKPAPKPKPNRSMILVEAFNDFNEVVTSKVRVTLDKVGADYSGTASFPDLNLNHRVVTIVGLRAYLKASDTRPTLVMHCQPRRVSDGDVLTVELVIKNNLEFKQKVEEQGYSL